MKNNINHLKKNAKIAGLLYLLNGVTGAYALAFVPGQVWVQGNSSATVTNIVNNEFLFRTGIVSNLISAVGSIYMSIAFYKLFKGVNENLSRLLLSFNITYAAIIFVAEALNITALTLAKGGMLESAAALQKREMAMLFYTTHRHILHVVEALMGLWLIPLAQLFYRSRFMPRTIAVLLFIGAAGYIIDCLAGLLFPYYSRYTNPIGFTMAGVAEIPVLLWLLFKGIKNTFEPGMLSGYDPSLIKPN